MSQQTAVDEVMASVEELLDELEELGSLGPCATLRMASLAIVSGTGCRTLVEAGLAAAEATNEKELTVLFREYLSRDDPGPAAEGSDGP